MEILLHHPSTIRSITDRWFKTTSCVWYKLHKLSSHQKLLEAFKAFGSFCKLLESGKMWRKFAQVWDHRPRHCKSAPRCPHCWTSWYFLSFRRFQFVINLKYKIVFRLKTYICLKPPPCLFALSQYPSIQVSQYPSIPVSQYPNIPVSQYPSIPGGTPAPAIARPAPPPARWSK